MRNKVYSLTEKLLHDMEHSQEEMIEKVADAIVDTLQNHGIIQAYGSGHSYGGALEITHRAGGFIPSKCIKEPSMGQYEGIEGVGKIFMKKVDIRPEDIIFIISNSGRNPLPIDMALCVHEKGAKVVAVTSVEASKTMTSKHSSGKRLFEVADFVLDNCAPLGDAGVEISGLDYKVCGMSSITTAILLEAVTCRAIEKCVERGVEPLIYKSQNIDGGREFNEKIEKEYIERLYRF